MVEEDHKENSNKKIMNRPRNIRDSHKKYKEISENPISEKDYVKINNAFNKFLIGKALEGHKVTLPGRCGLVWVNGKKRKLKVEEDGKITGLPIDWVKTKEVRERNPKFAEEKKVIYITNPHTDGYVYKWFWSKKKIYIENKSLYGLQMSRDNKRAIWKAISNGGQFINS